VPSEDDDDPIYRPLFGPRCATVCELRAAVAALWKSIADDQRKAKALTRVLDLLTSVGADDDLPASVALERATGILARIAENTAKLALIRAVGFDPVTPVIRAIDAEWAARLVRHCADHTISQVEQHVADNAIEANHKRVLGIIRSAGAAGVTKNELARRTQFLDQRQRSDLIASLVEAGQIATAMRPSATRPAMVFRIAEEQTP
jgi:hypothetical protein